MSKYRPLDREAIPAAWQSADSYTALMHADRRSFAWEWLRRHAPYRAAWLQRSVSPATFGLLAFEDPDQAVPGARPIWAPSLDRRVIDSKPIAAAGPRADFLDIRAFASFVSVEVDECDTEYWLISDGRWMVRLDLHEGTLLGGPTLLEHHLLGLESARPKLHALRQLMALARDGDMPGALQPHEGRAPRWILELRAADACRAGASQQEIARVFFGSAIPETRWRTESESYRLRVRRLVRTARTYLAEPLKGPWFD